MSSVRLTNHAQEKLEVLKRYGFEVPLEQIEETLLSPELVIPQTGGKFVAQKGITERHVLRVVYRLEGDDYVVITLYPGRRGRYEDSL